MTPAPAAAAFAETPIPARAGIGLRAVHYRELLRRLPPVGWLEAHSENYFGAGGQPLHYLERLRDHYPLSLHGVGLSLGSTDPLDGRHLGRLKSLCERFQPHLVSEHLCWSSVAGRFVNELMPLPYNRQALTHVVARISRVQDFLGRRILVENLSSYLEYDCSEQAEWEFVAEVARRSGCALLLDVNNVYVNAVNHGFDAAAYLRAMPREAVQEIHLAGYTEQEGLLIDTHGAPVSEPVWDLYRQALALFGPRPTLIEWDNDIPALDVLLAEAAHAQRLLERQRDALVA